MALAANLGSKSLHTVVMLRHGESLWNMENRFTGWCDVPLTEQGEADAVDAGVLIGERGLKFDVAFTSNLERAWRTCALTLAAAGQSGVEIIRSSMLNERHYGGKHPCVCACNVVGFIRYFFVPPQLCKDITKTARS